MVILILAIVLFIIIIIIIIIIYESGKADDLAHLTTDYRVAMLHKFNELRDDPAMTDAKWREWLPIFEDAEELFAKTHPHIRDFYRPSEHIKAELAGDELPR